MPHSSRRAGVLIAAAMVFLGACSGGSSGPSWVNEARVDASQQGPADVDADLPSTVGCEPLGVDDPVFASAPVAGGSAGEVNRGTENDPHTATGARQLAGPDMERLAPPDSPVSVVVARPVDPDQHVAARQADGVDTGPVPPSRYMPGRGSSASIDGPSTSSGATNDDAPEPSATGASASCIPVLGP